MPIFLLIVGLLQVALGFIPPHSEKDIKFINMTQSLGNGMYSLCVKGKIMKYKKVGTVFMRAEANPMGN